MSPDLNPIEQVFAKLKMLVRMHWRKAGSQTTSRYCCSNRDRFRTCSCPSVCPLSNLYFEQVGAYSIPRLVSYLHAGLKTAIGSVDVKTTAISFMSTTRSK